MKIKKWKELERHELSAAYPDIKGPAWKAFVANIQEVGNVTGRRIMLFGGKVLDGWQFYRACVEANKQPEFITLPRGMDPEMYVETVNAHRRHETQEQSLERVTERRKRVADARKGGASTRTIAEEEGVSSSTIRKDLEKLTVQGFSVQPESGVVNSKDGVKRPAQSRAERLGLRPPTPFQMREAGDDTESEAKAKQDAKTDPKSGKAKFDWKPAEASVGILIREVDKLGKAYGIKDRADLEALRKDQAEWLKRLKEIYHKVAKQKAPE